MSTYEPVHKPRFPRQVPQYQPVPVATDGNVAVVTTAPAPVSRVIIINSVPNNYLVLNIITLLFCCFIFGLIGLMYSLKVGSEWNRGNHQGAYQASRAAQGWGIAGIITGLVTIGVLVVTTIIVIAVATLAAS